MFILRKKLLFILTVKCCDKISHLNLMKHPGALNSTYTCSLISGHFGLVSVIKHCGTASQGTTSLVRDH